MIFIFIILYALIKKEKLKNINIKNSRQNIIVVLLYNYKMIPLKAIIINILIDQMI
jgi:hypothetical protein